jgi:hypothetical protein
VYAALVDELEKQEKERKREELAQELKRKMGK